MESEFKVLLDADASTGTSDQTQTSTRVKTFQVSRLTLALMAFTLCLATGGAVFLFSNARVKVSVVFKKGQRPATNSYYII